MLQSDFNLIGRGVYSLTEASRLTRVPLRRMRRWTQGYWYTLRDKRQWSAPVIGTDLGLVGGAPALDFADLIEVRFLNSFRDLEISWASIRLAAERAKQILETDHPFSSQRFMTDGQTILARIVDESGELHLLDLVRNQWELERVVLEFCRRELQFDGADHPIRWWPLGLDRLVVVDPARSFGAPIVSQGSIRTRVLYGAYIAEGSVEAVADWYSTTPAAVSDAIEFEGNMRGARAA
jgi:uncharacterized protein (DUF433 family)